MMALLSDPEISVVVPCYNEAECLLSAYNRLKTAMEASDLHYEIIFVDDGSRDETLDLMKQIASTNRRVRAVALSRNFGHQIAVTAGIDCAVGAAVVLIDADLQDPPELIPDMVRLWRAGAQVVYGKRRSRKGESAFKLATASMFYRLLNGLSEIRIPEDTGDFRLMDRVVVDALAKMPERSRYIRGMVSWVGYRQTALEYDREERFAGSSKYPLKKMLKFATDGILSFSTKPLKIATTLGLWTSFLALIGIFYVIYMRLFTTTWVSGWSLLMLAVLLLGGAQMVSLGIIGEYIGRIYNESKARPQYLLQYDSYSAIQDLPSQVPAESAKISP